LEGLVFIFDDILLSPAKGLFWVFKEIHKAAQKELAGEADRLTQELAALYRRLETGELSESAFDELERKILDRLDELSAMQQDDDGDDDGAEASDADDGADDDEEDQEDEEDEEDGDDEDTEDEEDGDEGDEPSVELGLEGLIAEAQAEQDDDDDARGHPQDRQKRDEPRLRSGFRIATRCRDGVETRGGGAGMWPAGVIIRGRSRSKKQRV
jgi:hypothetical protein